MLRTPLFLGLGLIGGLILGCGEKDGIDSEPGDSSVTNDTNANDDSGADDSSEPADEDCGNGADDDGDGDVDCADADCADDQACLVEDCLAPGDEDGDGAGECADEDCADEAACVCIEDSLSNGLGELATGDSTGWSDDWTNDGTEDGCGSDDSSAPDAVFVWSAPDEGCFNFNTDGTEYDTVLRLVNGCDGGELECNDDSEFGLQSSLNVAAMPGQPFLIVVDGYGEGDEGSFVLNVADAEPVIEADLADGTGDSLASGDNSASTALGRVDGCGSSPGATLIFAWTAPESGTYVFDTYGSDFDTILGLFSFEVCQYEELSCDDDGEAEVNNESEFSAEVVGGQRYLIEVSGFSGATGNYVLNINPAADG